MIRLFRVSIPASVLALFVLETVLVLACYIAAAYFVIDEDAGVLLVLRRGLAVRSRLVTAVIQLGLYFQDLYEHLRPRSRIYLAQQVSLVLGVAFLLQAVLGYGRSTLQLNKWTMVYGSLLVLLVLPLWRLSILFRGQQGASAREAAVPGGLRHFARDRGAAGRAARAGIGADRILECRASRIVRRPLARRHGQI